MKLPRVLAAWSDAWLCWLLAGIAALCALPLLLFTTWPKFDVAYLYAPMIREFAAGHWDGAFFAMTPPLTVCLGGLFAWLGLPAFAAARLASFVLFVLTVWPLFYLHRRWAGREVAFCGVLLFILCGRVLQYAASGLRHSGEALFLVLLGYGLAVFLSDRSWRSVLWLGVGGAGLCLTWGGGEVLVVPALALALAADCWRPAAAGGRRWALPTRSLAAIGLFAVLMAPWTWWEYRVTGYPVPDVRLVPVLRQLGARVGWRLPPPRQSAAMNAYADVIADIRTTISQRLPPHFSAAAAAELPSAVIADLRKYGCTVAVSPWQRLRGWWDQVGQETWKGLFPPYLVLAVIAVWSRRSRREWSPEERLLAAGIVIVPAALALLVGWVTSRYIAVVIPLLVGWSAWGLAVAAGWLEHRWPRQHSRMLVALLVAAAAVLLADGTKDVWSRPRPKVGRERQSVLACAAWLREHGRELVPPDQPALPSHDRDYHNGRRPVILAINSPVPFFAAADLVLLHFPPVVLPQQTVAALPEHLTAVCRAAHVNFVIWDQDLLRYFPELADLAQLPPEFTILYDDRPHGDQRAIVGFRPNLRLPPADGGANPQP